MSIDARLGARTEFRIYPSIGVARIGDSRDSFTIGPEAPALAPSGPFRGADQGLKPQAARFRIYKICRALVFCPGSWQLRALARSRSLLAALTLDSQPEAEPNYSSLADNQKVCQYFKSDCDAPRFSWASAAPCRRKPGNAFGLGPTLPRSLNVIASFSQK
ncbi:LodA/GoxA family CTQ-dependent oxidase [Bradyrhizobium barranii]|uniref:L-Lysine epsilon oxidase N-terminal domain-containing protein n=1 Tax=Bradyrhizobium barranii subsp. barranii TaxID=2823807 RepID=A0A7Z0Q867_9BRAD